MKRFLPLLALLGVLPVSGQFAQFPADATKFLSGANTWVVPGTFGAISATTVDATDAVLLESTVAISGRLTVGAGVKLTPTTLVPASSGTNYGIDMALWSSAYKSMTNVVAFTGITNNAAGAYFRAMLYNGSGGNLVVRAPAGSIFQDEPVTGAAAFPLTVTNTTAVLIEVFGMGTASTNALWAYRRFIP